MQWDHLSAYTQSIAPLFLSSSLCCSAGTAGKMLIFLSSVTSELLLIFPLVAEAAVKQHNRDTTMFLKIGVFLYFSNSHK